MVEIKLILGLLFDQLAEFSYDRQHLGTIDVRYRMTNIVRIFWIDHPLEHVGVTKACRNGGYGTGKTELPRLVDNPFSPWQYGKNAFDGIRPLCQYLGEYRVEVFSRDFVRFIEHNLHPTPPNLFLHHIAGYLDARVVRFDDGNSLYVRVKGFELVVGNGDLVCRLLLEKKKTQS